MPSVRPGADGRNLRGSGTCRPFESRATVIQQSSKFRYVKPADARPVETNKSAVSLRCAAFGKDALQPVMSQVLNPREGVLVLALSAASCATRRMQRSRVCNGVKIFFPSTATRSLQHQQTTVSYVLSVNRPLLSTLRVRERSWGSCKTILE